MALSAIQVALQAVSTASLAGALVYAGVQFRQLRRAQYVANFSRLVELQMELRRMRVDDPSLASVYRHDVEHARSDRDIREYFFNLMQLSLFEIAWFSHRHGQIPDDYFRSWVRHMQAIGAEESFRRMWADIGTKIMHHDFQAYVESLMRASAPVGGAPAAGAEHD